MKPSGVSHKDSQQYFTVAAQALVSFAQNKTSALAICSYLVLSRYRLKSSSSTAASTNALCKLLNIGVGKAKKTISELLSCKYENRLPLLSKHLSDCNCREICDSDEDYEKLIEAIHSEENRKVAFPKYDFMNVKGSILVSNTLIDNNCNKLKYLIRNNDHRACLMLLAMHHYYDYILDGVISGVCAIESHEIRNIYNENGIAFWNGTIDKEPSIPGWLRELIFGQDEFRQSDVNRVFSTLEHAGLITRVICVMPPRGSNPEQNFHYELDIKTKDSLEKLSCHNLAYRIRKNVQDKGCAVGRKDNRFYNEYVFAAPSDNEVEMRVLYRLPFAMRNMKNLDVQEGIKFRQQNYEKVCKWIDIAEYNGLC